MEIDPVNQARDVTASLNPGKVDQAEKTSLEHKVDLSQEHTNGRMFEQAVQNANKTHETSAPPDVTRQADSKIDREARAAIDRPLVLNDKQASEEQEAFYTLRDKERLSAEEIMLEVFAGRDIEPIRFSTLSLDLIALNGRKMDELMQARQESKPASKPPQPEDDNHDNKADSQKMLSLKTSSQKDAQPHILFDSKRARLTKLAEATYKDVMRIEEELGKTFDDSLVKDLNAKAFGEEVTGILMG